MELFLIAGVLFFVLSRPSPTPAPRPLIRLDTAPGIYDPLPDALALFGAHPTDVDRITSGVSNIIDAAQGTDVGAQLRADRERRQREQAAIDARDTANEERKAALRAKAAAELQQIADQKAKDDAAAAVSAATAAASAERRAQLAQLRIGNQAQFDADLQAYNERTAAAWAAGEPERQRVYDESAAAQAAAAEAETSAYAVLQAQRWAAAKDVPDEDRLIVNEDLADAGARGTLYGVDYAGREYLAALYREGFRRDAFGHYLNEDGSIS